MSADERAPRPFTVDRRKLATPLLAWQRQGSTSTLAGDADEDGEHRFEGLPLYVREKVNPATIVEQMRRRGSGVDLSLLDDFNGLPPTAEAWEFYQHSGHWQNRLIHGDSADVMKSLISRDGLAGCVQMIYYDPPYGMSYRSNFQPSTRNLSVKDDRTAVPAGDALPIRAFRDTYANGIDSYLDIIHSHAVLFRELLTESGSLFIQIGDENVHRLAVLLDEVFGAENRVATITWRPTGGSSAALLPESASYLLWYAKDRDRVKYNQLFEPLSRTELLKKLLWAPQVELSDGTTRTLSARERAAPDQLPESDRVFGSMILTSQGYSNSGRSVDYIFNGYRYSTSKTRQWSVSVHEPRHSTGSEDYDHCPGDPDEFQEVCGMCSLKHQNRLVGRGTQLHWKWYEDESAGRRIDNVWNKLMRPSRKRYVVQTADSVIERCMLMTTEPGDLVLDPTCGSGATADVAESWGRRWITSDVQRVAVAVARTHLLTRPYPWHMIVGGGTDPAAGFKEESIPRVSAATLAYGTVNDPENRIRLVERTQIDSKRLRVASLFTVESINPYSYVPLTAAGDPTDAQSRANDPQSSSLPDAQSPAADTVDAEALLDALRSTPVCDSAGRALFDVLETTAWPGARLATHGAKCAGMGRDDEFNAAVMVAASDATVTKEAARRAAIEARSNDPDCEHLVIIGYDFEAGIDTAIQKVQIHRVAADKALQLPATVKKGADGGSFTLLAEPDCEIRHDDDGNLTVELLGCDAYNPATGEVTSADLSEVDCWMIDTDHDGLSFFAQLTYFPGGVRNGKGFKELMRSLKGDLDPEAEKNLTSTISQPFPPPAAGRNIAVKVITNTGAEMTRTIDI